jgi:tRNA threonylcarbamoyladenosine biosynthesis protein TsaB
MSYRILSIETASESASIALSQGTEVLSRSLGDIPQKHSRSILPAIEALLAEGGMSLKNLDAIAVGKGPGSFTGVRLGLSVAQGLCFGLEIPCVPISTLQILAYGAKNEVKEGVTKVLAAMDARMEEVYMGIYELKDSCITSIFADCVTKPSEINPKLFENHFQNDKRIIATGTGWQIYQPALLEASKLDPIVIRADKKPQAADLAELAMMAMEKGECVTPEACVPAYCRDKVV